MTTAPDRCWLQIVACCDQAELLELALESAGALAVTLRGLGEEVLIEAQPGAAPLWQRTELLALFPTGTDPEPIGRELESQLHDYHLRWDAELLEDRDWVRSWMDAYQPMRFGQRLWVCPRHADIEQSGAVVVRLDPGLAFGTGTHATTALCLEWLDAHPPRDRLVLDYGCGSGVLALAAAALGATTAQAVDTDHQALLAARENAQANGLSNAIRVDAVECALSADIILANILAGPLIELAPRLISLLRPGGRLILAGILAHQSEAVQAAYAPEIRFDGGAARDGWVRLDGRQVGLQKPA